MQEEDGAVDPVNTGSIGPFSSLSLTQFFASMLVPSYFVSLLRGVEAGATYPKTNCS